MEGLELDITRRYPSTHPARVNVVDEPAKHLWIHLTQSDLEDGRGSSGRGRGEDSAVGKATQFSTSLLEPFAPGRSEGEDGRRSK